MRGKKFLSLLLLLSLAVLPQIVLADGVAEVLPDPTLPPEWLRFLLVWLQSVPAVGPILTEVMKWVGVVAAVMTALSYAVQAIMAIPEIVARFSGAPQVADKIKYWSDKILYWLKFFSIRNAQK